MNCYNNLFFNPVDSLYKGAFKFHRFTDAVYISISAMDESVGYTEKLFPGDDSDRITVKRKKEIYFKVDKVALEEKLFAHRDAITPMIFEYILGNDGEADVLTNFYLLDEIDMSVVKNLKTFPNKIENEWDYTGKDIDLSDCW